MPFSASYRPDIDGERLIDLAVRLLRFESPSGGEGKIAEYLASYLESEGLTVELQELDRVDPEVSRYNVIARLPGHGTGPRVLLSGHTDVVPPGTAEWTFPPFEGEIRDGRIYGRGAADMKGGLAAMVAAVAALRRSGRRRRGELILAFVGGEESDQSGTRRLVASPSFAADYAYVGEPTELRPVVCHNGLVSVTVTVVGSSAHASRPEEGQNAIDGMYLFLHRLQQLRDEVARRTHPMTGHATLTPGTIRGGEVSNMVPDRCSLELDRRLLPGELAQDAVAEIVAAADSVHADHGEFELTVEQGLTESPLETPDDHRVVTALCEAIRNENADDAVPQGWTATCDAGLIASQWAVPTVVFGPGSISQAHKPDEYLETEELFAAARIYARTLHKLVGD